MKAKINLQAFAQQRKLMTVKSQSTEWEKIFTIVETNNYYQKYTNSSYNLILKKNNLKRAEDFNTHFSKEDI